MSPGKYPRRQATQSISYTSISKPLTYSYRKMAINASHVCSEGKLRIFIHAFIVSNSITQHKIRSSVVLYVYFVEV